MKISEIDSKSVRKMTDKELINLHWRIHLLYKTFKKKNDKEALEILKAKHEILVKEMKRRGIKHNSPLL